MTTGSRRVERVPVPLLADDPRAPRSLAGVAERRRAGRSGRAAPRAAGTCPRARSGSRSRCSEERVRQPPRDAVDRHLALGHRLEQRRLRLRHRAVDLVDEDDVREDRAGPELELARLLVEDREAGDVGRLQVGRALDPRRASRPRSLPAIARASTVFAVPGTSSSSTWPPQTSAARTSRISSRLPWTTVSMLSSKRRARSVPAEAVTTANPDARPGRCLRKVPAYRLSRVWNARQARFWRSWPGSPRSP